MASGSTPASSILSRALLQPRATHAVDRRLAACTDGQSAATKAGAPRPGRHRPQPPLAGRAVRAPRGRSPTICWPRPEVRRAATRRGVRLDRVASPAPACCSTRLAAAGKRVILPVLLPDGDLDWAAYAGDDALAPAEVRAARAGRADARASTRSRRADVVLVPGLAVSSRRETGWAAAAGPTTGRSAACRWARSRASCSTRTRSASTSPSSRTTAGSPRRPPRPGSRTSLVEPAGALAPRCRVSTRSLRSRLNHR